MAHKPRQVRDFHAIPARLAGRSPHLLPCRQPKPQLRGGPLSSVYVVDFVHQTRSVPTSHPIVGANPSRLRISLLACKAVATSSARWASRPVLIAAPHSPSSAHPESWGTVSRPSQHLGRSIGPFWQYCSAHYYRLTRGPILKQNASFSRFQRCWGRFSRLCANAGRSCPEPPDLPEAPTDSRFFRTEVKSSPRRPAPKQPLPQSFFAAQVYRAIFQRIDSTLPNAAVASSSC